MVRTRKTVIADDRWETGELGRDEPFVRRSPVTAEPAVDDALDLQLISIRLQKQLLRELKLVARYRRIGYQPLIRDVLGRWVRGEMRAIAEETDERERTSRRVAAATVARRRGD
jgi:hypothetical protein